MAVEVYGASDDLIEIDGDISEEFGAYDETDGTYLGFSDGTVLHILFDQDGVWRIKPIVHGHGGPEALTITQAPVGDDRNHTDRARLSGDVRWVLRGKDLARRNGR
jgi:hypothetical protein